MGKTGPPVSCKVVELVEEGSEPGGEKAQRCLEQSRKMGHWEEGYASFPL